MASGKVSSFSFCVLMCTHVLHVCTCINLHIQVRAYMYMHRLYIHVHGHTCNVLSVPSQPHTQTCCMRTVRQSSCNLHLMTGATRLVHACVSLEVARRKTGTTTMPIKRRSLNHQASRQQLSELNVSSVHVTTKTNPNSR